MVTYLIGKMVASSVSSRPLGTITKLSANINICKYRGLHEGHHFISMAMEVHDTLGHDMDCFIKECACIFHNRRSRGHLPLFFFAFSFLNNVLVLFLVNIKSLILYFDLNLNWTCHKTILKKSTHSYLLVFSFKIKIQQWKYDNKHQNNNYGYESKVF